MASTDKNAVCLYNLRQLFGGDVTIVIPDMQRDYCWGAEKYTDTYRPNKVSLYVASLVRLFEDGECSTLGMLYGYEWPAGSAHLCIIDGQQRLTTLYLLTGILYRRTPTIELRRLLISDYELLDDREPRLQYQARSEAQYFMSDLVSNFFLNRDGRLSQLEQSKWYYHTYVSDPTIQSFISAIRHIDHVLEEASTHPGWDFDAFARYITSSLQFVYYDLPDRYTAEQMYLTINTTGEPLTLAQNLKSMFISASTDSATSIGRWEDMEQWAWIHRDISDPLRPQTSDHALVRFLRIWLAQRKHSAYDIFSQECLDDLYANFSAYRTLIDAVPEALRCEASKAEDMYLIVPTLKYILKWADDASAADIQRFWRFLSNIACYQRVSSSGSDMALAQRIVELMPEPDTVSLIRCGRSAPERLLNDEERSKLTLIAEHIGHREKVEALIDRAQRHPMLCGRVSRLITWATDRDGHFSVGRFEYYIESIYSLWGYDIDRNPSLDALRRVLLTMRHPAYPIVRRGETALSLCWHDYDWQRLMINAPGLIRGVIDRVSNFSNMPVHDALLLISDRFRDREYPYYFLIKQPEVMSGCLKRMLLRPSQPLIGYYEASDDARSAGSTRWYVEQQPIEIDCRYWTTMRPYGCRCLYTDSRIYDVAVNIWCSSDQQDPRQRADRDAPAYTHNGKYSYRVELLNRRDASPSRIHRDVAQLVSELRLPMRHDKKQARYYCDFNNARSALTFLTKILISQDL